ncbi:zeta tubulin, putative [Leishmania donovani]|uniref:Tubulin/FtsZ family, GTPase domain protein n=1 Tax=Leishmania donovani TaxID=5661 RepID=A0A3S5H784_LEIDO|nr:zeta tubulin, putative [Leishmania donovani]AYU78333.1 zeta tubulin, putative [Leishmania donovani]TPP49945.1 Tubulin/FtsZ family, GTPase domain protein [Leishmania donovani]CBZ33687.1 zeta tubulin, putative [Leishmania donovani]
MAIVVVLIGQCGNQLGDELFTQLALCTSSSASSEAAKSPSRVADPSPFFALDGKARCILVDTEPKVVLGVQQRHPDFIRAENVIHGQSGRGNNWGLGYYGVKTEQSKRTERNAAVQRAFRNIARDQREEDDNVLRKALQAIHRETRRTSDAEDGSGGFESILVLHSLVGGTGSGLASRLTARLRLYFTEPPPGQQVDEVYESKMMHYDGFDSCVQGTQRRARHLVNITVAPQALGEVATQGLNAALTLQVLQRHADAILLLRNDDAMAPGEPSGSSACSSASLLTRCVTFKEANEILVALLLPVLGYGRQPGCITNLLIQCIPPTYKQTTGGNKILTLLAAPQRSYATMRQCVHRAMFFIIKGGRTFMPGYVPTVPMDEMLSRTALRIHGVGSDHVRRGSDRPSTRDARGNGDDGVAQHRLFDYNTKKLGSRRLGSDNGGEARAGTAATAASSLASRRRQRSTLLSVPSPPSPPSARMRGGEGRFGSCEDDESGSATWNCEDLEELNQRVYLECVTTISPALYLHYLQLRRAPVTKMFEALDGVLVLNQAVELNRRVLLPLLRSAALKVSCGAFMSAYEDVGVKSEHVRRAYREVAEVLAAAEEL